MTSDLSHELYAAKWMDVQTMLSELTVPEGKTSSSLDLSEVLTAEVLNPILGDAVIRETLFPFVNHSREERSPQEIEELVSSQQFKERLQLLNYALERDVLTAIIEALDSEKSNEEKNFFFRTLLMKFDYRSQVFFEGYFGTRQAQTKQGT